MAQESVQRLKILITSFLITVALAYKRSMLTCELLYADGDGYTLQAMVLESVVLNQVFVRMCVFFLLCRIPVGQAIRLSSQRNALWKPSKAQPSDDKVLLG